MKKELRKLIVTSFALVMTFTAGAQWSLIHSIYNGALAGDGAASFSIGDKGYIVAGSASSDIYMYDTLANTWTNKGPTPATMGQAFAMSFTLNGKGYVVGGDTAGVPTSAVWQYDPVSTTPWTQLSYFGGGPRDAGIAFVVNDTAYVGCGFDGSIMHGDLWRYDEANDDWILITLTPSILMFSTSFVVNNKAYIVSGGTFGGLYETNQMWEFNSATQTFTPKANFPGTARQAALSFANSGYGYFGGGMSGYTTNYYDMWRYNPDSNVWSPAAAIPLFGAAWSSVFTVGNTAYAGLGAKFVGSALQGTDSFYRYRMQMPTSVPPLRSQVAARIYPNPVSNLFYVDAAAYTEGELVICNYLGETIMTAAYKQGRGVNVTALASGYYTMRLETTGGISVISFVKQ